MSTEPSSRTLLVTVTGRDRPGVTSALFDALAGHPLVVVDVEQVVIRGRLTLGVLVSGPAGESAGRAALQRALEPLQMDVDVMAGSDEEAPGPTGRSHVTLLGHPLRPGAMAGIAGSIADYG